MLESGPEGEGAILAAELVKQLVDAGVHFGHRVSRWNPKMKPYIFGKRNLIHIINVKETLRGILLAKKFIQQVVGDGKDVLFVGTKRQARNAVEKAAGETAMHCVSDRWLGGTLTNFREIRKRVGRLDHLEKLEAEGMLDAYSKKQGASLRREMKKIQRNLGGIRRMERLPGVLFIIDQRREIIAVKEANKMGIPVICLLDTDCDPDIIAIPIPGNDDAMRAIELITHEMSEAAKAGKGVRDKEDEGGEGPRRRSRRPAMGRAEEVEAKPEVAEAPPAEQPAAPAEDAAAKQPAEDKA